MATLKQLTTFLAVAETMQMSEAARLLYLSQSTVSQTILDLEREFGAALFQRGARQLVLTPKGMILREQAQQVVERYEGLTRAMEMSHGIRELRLGATLTIGNTLLTGILTQLRAGHPDIRPYLYVENTRLLEGRILRHEADIGLIEGIVASEKLARLPVAEDELRLICGPRHPFWGREVVEPEELLEQSFILREQGSGTRDIFESAMRAAQIPIHVSGSRSAARRFWSWWPPIWGWGCCRAGASAGPWRRGASGRWPSGATRCTATFRSAIPSAAPSPARCGTSSPPPGRCWSGRKALCAEQTDFQNKTQKNPLCFPS